MLKSCYFWPSMCCEAGSTPRCWQLWSSFMQPKRMPVDFKTFTFYRRTICLRWYCQLGALMDYFSQNNGVGLFHLYKNQLDAKQKSVIKNVTKHPAKSWVWRQMLKVRQNWRMSRLEQKVERTDSSSHPLQDEDLSGNGLHLFPSFLR